MEIKNWLSEYKTLTDEKKAIYGESLRNNERLIEELYDLFEEELDAETIDPVCHQMFDFFRSGNPHLKRFVLDFVPTFLSSYFANLGSAGPAVKHRSNSLETCLLGIYNLDSSLDVDKTRTERMTIPSIHTPSIYHQPILITNPVQLTESLINGQRTKPFEYNSPQYPYLENINSQNRSFVIARILRLYNSEISNILPKSHWALCKFCCRLLHTPQDNDTFEDACSEEIDLKNETNTPETPQSNFQHNFPTGMSLQEVGLAGGSWYFRIDSDVLLELLIALYYIMHNGEAENALIALDSIYSRAMYDLMPDVLLAAEAMRNSINDLKNDANETLGVPLTLSPNLTQPTIRDAITNASFKTQKLPDDIDVLDGGDDVSIVSDSPLNNTNNNKKLPKLNIKIPTKKKQQTAATPRKTKDLVVTAIKSPKHSISVSTGLSTGALNGSIEITKIDMKLVTVETVPTNKFKEGPMCRSASNKVSDEDQFVEISESSRSIIFSSKVTSRDDDVTNRRFSEVPRLVFEVLDGGEKAKEDKMSRHLRQMPEAGDC